MLLTTASVPQPDRPPPQTPSTRRKRRSTTTETQPSPPPNKHCRFSKHVEPMPVRIGLRLHRQMRGDPGAPFVAARPVQTVGEIGRDPADVGNDRGECPFGD